MPDKPKVSSWAVFLGRSPPMPPVPAGGWTRDTVNAAWRDKIASHPEGAPLSHADLAELLRMRDTFGNWFIPRVIRTENEPPAPEASFFLQISCVPIICFHVSFFIALLIFGVIPKTRSFYNLIFLSEDTLCVGKRVSWDWRPSRCDALVWATDFAFLITLIVSGLIVFLFLRKGGLTALLHSQSAKKAIEFGGVGLIFFMAKIFFFLLWYYKFYVFDQNVIDNLCVIFGGLLIPSLIWYFLMVFRSLRAAFVMVFFYLTGRFPIWLKDLSS